MTKRVFITQDPYIALDQNQSVFTRGIWPCQWVSCPSAGERPFVTAYRLRFTLEEPAVVRAHVSADERYELYLDGQRIARGSERGDMDHWFFETYDIDLAKGEHVLVARTWALGEAAAYAQMTVAPGFLFATEGKFTKLLGTGNAQWEAKKLGGYKFLNPRHAWGTGCKVEIDGNEYPWGVEKGEGEGWEPVAADQPGIDARRCIEYPREDRSKGKYWADLAAHVMKPATLPAMMEERRKAGVARFVADAAGLTADQIEKTAVKAEANLPEEQKQWDALLRGEAGVTIPANAARRVIIDLQNYYCGYPELLASGGQGAVVSVQWAEALHLEPRDDKPKGNRNEIEGKFFVGIGDLFHPDGGKGRLFETLWWEAGRYLEITVQTSGEALTVDRLGFRETRYPLQMEAKFDASDARLTRVTPILLRGLSMCAHETYMDCPYYEQLEYIGDTRMECLVTYCITRDDRLPRKALRMFEASRLRDGLTQSRYPGRVRQEIPPFSLWWVAMVHDFMMWRGDKAVVAGLMNGVRSVLDTFHSFYNADGLVEGPTGWNFMDWVRAWKSGVPPEGDFGVSGLINWQMVWVLGQAAELEEWLGEKELAARARRMAAELGRKTAAAFFDEKRGLFADDLAKQRYSEHTQCLAILSGRLAAEQQEQIGRAMLAQRDLERTTIYFTHYLFETYRVLGLAEAIDERLNLWFELEKNGFKTTFEQPEPSRSDCHGWGSHPLYHYFATILGIRPSKAGFEEVRIRPMLGTLKSARGLLAHPRGDLEVDLHVAAGKLTGWARLPKGISGELIFERRKMPLHEGEQEISL